MIKWCRPQVAPDFNFAAFVSDYLAEEFSSVVKFDVFMWLLAVVWVAFPKGWYAGFAVTGLFIALSVASGAKLHAVAINMALQAPPDPAAAADAVAVAIVDSPPATGAQVRHHRPAVATTCHCKRCSCTNLWVTCLTTVATCACMWLMGV